MQTISSNNIFLYLDWDTEGYTSGYSTGGGGYDRIKPVWSQPDITPVAWEHQVCYFFTQILHSIDGSKSLKYVKDKYI